MRSPQTLRLDETSASTLPFAQTGTAPGPVERAFSVDGIPGILWSPALAMGPAPLVLMGHAGGRHTRSPGLGARAAEFVRTFGFHAAVIDAAEDPGRAVPEWQAATEALLALPAIDADRPVGYAGTAGATEIGLRLAAADARIGVAALWSAPASDALVAVARRVRIPVQFLLPWDDPEIDRESAIALFGALGSEVTSLHVFPGSGETVPASETEDAAWFVARRLLAPTI